MNPHKGCRPKGEVVTIAQPDEFLCDLVTIDVVWLNVQYVGEERVYSSCGNEFLHERDVHHINGQPLDRHEEVRDGHAHSFADGAFAGEIVARGGYFLISAVVFDEYFQDCVVFCVCHTSHS